MSASRYIDQRTSEFETHRWGTIRRSWWNRTSHHPPLSWEPDRATKVKVWLRQAYSTAFAKSEATCPCSTLAESIQMLRVWMCYGNNYIHAFRYYLEVYLYARHVGFASATSEFLFDAGHVWFGLGSCRQESCAASSRLRARPIRWRHLDSLCVLEQQMDSIFTSSLELLVLSLSFF